MRRAATEAHKRNMTASNSGGRIAVRREHNGSRLAARVASSSSARRPRAAAAEQATAMIEAAITVSSATSEANVHDKEHDNGSDFNVTQRDYRLILPFPSFV